MSSPPPRRPRPRRPDSDRLAWRVALRPPSASASGACGRPARRLRADLRRRRGRPARRRSRSTTARRSAACSAAARPAPARPTWTGCGPAPTCRPCCGSPPATGRRWRCPAAGSGSRPSSPGPSRTGARRNTRAGSRRNIAAHYDLGNDFYRLFLDETMTYSSAVFASAGQSLADAQREQVPALRPTPGSRRPARPRDRHGLGRVRAVRGGRAGLPGDDRSRSRSEQFELARERVRDAGLEDLVDVQLRDYRDIEGTYDAIVSIEMLEAVGAEYLATFFETCDRALRPGRPPEPPGHHVPGRRLRAQLRGANWIQTYIFPGGLCPSLAVIERATATRGCSSPA